MKYEIKARWSSRVVFEAEIECEDGASFSLRLGLAVRAAIKSNADLRSADLSGADLRSADLRSADLRSADLSGADLRSADLRSADLSGANLSNADLSGADLRSADLRSADLSGADLSGADLNGAYLRSADLRSADLSGADLRSADLRSADLSGANLSGADLSGAYLSGANLSGAKWRDGIVLGRAPLYVGGLEYPVYILDSHMQIGCELHSLQEWTDFDNERIARMEGAKARRFWAKMKAPLLAMAAADGRTPATEAKEAAE